MLFIGLVVFATPIHLFGKSGLWNIFIVILLLLATSCMFSIVGASSILYHDVLVTYIRVSLIQMKLIVLAALLSHSGTSAELAIMHNRHCSADYADIVSQVCKSHHRICVQHKGNRLASRHQVNARDLLNSAFRVFSLQPYKKQVDKAICILCGKQRGHLASRRNICRCRSMLECAACDIDTWYDGM